jgi:hypothetical protein
MASLQGIIQAAGPIVTIAFGVSEPRRHALQQYGYPVPSPVHVSAPVDTGSHFTLAGHGVVQSFGVGPVSSQPVFSSASGLAPNPHPVFELSVALLDDFGHRVEYWPIVRVLGTTYDPGEIVQGIFGRDLLARCKLIYDGRGDCFSLDV